MEFLLRDHELLDLGGKLRGLRIVCLDGRCWLTQAGDNRDHILGRDDSFTVRSNGKVVITAAKSCRLMLEQKAEHGRHAKLGKMINGVLRECAAGI